jgi:2-(1,2-epoxy-1,2-dihydrophenyl)acetyl-CoA isomerase
VNSTIIALRYRACEEPGMQFDNLRCERVGEILTVTLNRPAKLNSLSIGLLRDLAACAEAIRREAGLRAVILTGAGRGFCAGADLTDTESPPRPGETLGQYVAGRLRTYYNPVARLWTDLPVPLVVAVNGITAGAGVSLALMGDITLAARSASFAVLFAPKLGLAPDMGATHFLATRVGQARARAIAMTGEAVPAEQAEQIGLIAACVDDAELGARARALAATLAASPTQALLAVRRLVNDPGVADLAGQLEREAAEQQTMGDTADFAEGLAAFREKRAARFIGR